MMKKFADAMLVSPSVSSTGWKAVRTAATHKKQAKALPLNLVDRATLIFGRPFNPNDYLLSHVTIVSSVDTYEPKDLSFTPGVNRPFKDYRITKETEKYINNNNDAFERKALLKAYPTFIGGHNFCEHVQIEELSKGRILDAVARDLGDTVYVDLLIATDRRHEELCKSIESKDLYTLSMGCTISYSICTQCGNKAVDESEMCDHIKYKKGSTFTDEFGNQAKVAELCGHASEEPNAGIQFVEASWVEVPAFAGAVLNDTLTVVAGDAQTPAVKQTPMKGKKKMAADWSDVDFSAAEEGGGDAPEEGAEAEPKDPFADLEDEATQLFIDKIRKNLKEVLDAKKEPAKTQTSPTQSNDSIVKSATVKQAAFRMAVKTLIKTASSDVEALDRLASFTQAHGIKVPLSVYRGLVMLGGDYSPENMRKLAQVGQLSESSRQLAEKIANLLSQRSLTKEVF